MTKNEAISEHQRLSAKRNELYRLHKNHFGDVIDVSILEQLKQLDRQVGRLAQAYNPRIADKAAKALSLA